MYSTTLGPPSSPAQTRKHRGGRDRCHEPPADAEHHRQDRDRQDREQHDPRRIGEHETRNGDHHKSGRRRHGECSRPAQQRSGDHLSCAIKRLAGKAGSRKAVPPSIRLAMRFFLPGSTCFPASVQSMATRLSCLRLQGRPQTLTPPRRHGCPRRVRVGDLESVRGVTRGELPSEQPSEERSRPSRVGHGKPEIDRITSHRFSSSLVLARSAGCAECEFSQQTGSRATDLAPAPGGDMIAADGCHT